MKAIKGPKPWHRYFGEDDIPTLIRYAKMDEPDALLSYANHIRYKTESIIDRIREKRLEKVRKLLQRAIDVSEKDKKWIYVLNLARTYNEKDINQAATALQLYEEAANCGSVSGMVMAAELYIHGWGVPKDYAKAAEWMKKAAETGCLA